MRRTLACCAFGAFGIQPFERGFQFINPAEQPQQRQILVCHHLVEGIERVFVEGKLNLHVVQLVGRIDHLKISTEGRP